MEECIVLVIRILLIMLLCAVSITFISMESYVIGALSTVLMTFLIIFDV